MSDCMKCLFYRFGGPPMEVAAASYLGGVCQGYYSKYLLLEPV